MRQPSAGPSAWNCHTKKLLRHARRQTAQSLQDALLPAAASALRSLHMRLSVCQGRMPQVRPSQRRAGQTLTPEHAMHCRTLAPKRIRKALPQNKHPAKPRQSGRPNVIYPLLPGPSAFPASTRANGALRGHGSPQRRLPMRSRTHPPSTKRSRTRNAKRTRLPYRRMPPSLQARALAHVSDPHGIAGWLPEP